MYYTIGEVAEKMNISTSAIRYYDRHGLLPFVDRDENGRRIFKDNDFNFLQVISCLKRSGVPIKIISHFIDLCMQGDSTLKQRYDYLDDEEKVLQEKINNLQAELDYLQYKKWYYKTAIEAGTESVHFTEGTRFVRDNVHDQYEEELKKVDDIKELIDFK